MPSRPARSAQSRRERATSLRQHGVAALSATSIALLAAMPTASALASSTGSDTGGSSSAPSAAAPRPLTAAGELLSAGQLQTLLAALPLDDLSTAQLAHYLAGLEGISVLASLHVGLLPTEELGLVGLEESLSHAIEQLGPAATIGELADTAALLPDLEAKLNNLLTSLLGSALGSSQQQELSKALTTLNLDQLVGALLAAANEPAQLSGLADLTGKLFGELGAEGLEGILGSSSPLAGGFAPTTVENVAHELSTTPELVSSELGQTAAQLPATATMLTAPVTGGKLLAVAPAVKGLALGLLGAVAGEGEGGGSSGGSGSGEGGKGGSGGGSGGSGQGGSGASGSGGPGGQGSGGNAGALTLIVSLPRAQSATSTAASGTSRAKPQKVAILSWKTKGILATITVQAPAAGHLTVHGAGILPGSHTVTRAQRVTLKVRLSKAGVVALHRRRGRLPVKLHLTFKTATGANSSAATTLTFR
jgi:hypothetical protein